MTKLAVRARASAAAVILATGLSAAPCAENAGEIWERIRGSRLDPGRAVELRSVSVDLALGRLELDAGVLIPAAPAGGSTAEAVFVGEGRLRIEPPDPLEQAQLELFTGQPALDLGVQRMVLVFNGPETASALLDRGSTVSADAGVLADATRLFDAWVQGPERRTFGAETALLAAAFDDADARRYFAMWIESEELGDIYYRYDPTELEPVTLGRFVALAADYREEHRYRQEIKRGQKKGRYKQLRFEDLGDWDTWVSSGPQGEDGRPRSGSAGVEPTHYTLEVTLDPTTESMRGSARVRMVPARDGKRLLGFSLFSELEVASVTDAEGRAIPWFRSADRLDVLVPQPTAAGVELEVEIEFGGKALVELVKGRAFALLDTYSWYPRIGDVDRATYDVTLRWPKKYELLASGRVVDGGEESDTRWERRTLDVPAIAFSFEVGEYEVRTAQAGHVNLTIGFAKFGDVLDKGVKDELVVTLQELLPFYEQTFGAYPLDYLTVATVPRGFSQGFLGFVTLTHYAVGLQRAGYVVYDSTFEDFSEYRQQSRTETLAHEISHQWWGNKVGWTTYRDQWLSEALADFSAATFMAHKSDRKSVYLARRGKGWRSSLGQGTPDGRSIESLGPVVMGSRLNSSIGSAYTAVVYDKGAVIFTMLAQLVGEEPLAAMLKTLADAVDNSTIDTPTFIRAIEKMSGLSLETFARQFVYGTGIPEIYYSYEFEPQADQSWIIRGEAKQVRASHARYRLQRTASDTWSVSRQRGEQAAFQPSAFIVPFQVALADAQDAVTTGHKGSVKTTTEKGLGGRVLIRGEVGEFSIRVPKEPRDFWLDQQGQVLARFYSEKHEPKRMLRYRATELAAAGRLDEAEELFKAALGAPLIPESELDDTELSAKEVERLSRLEDCMIRLRLSRVQLERGRDADAMGSLELAEDLLTNLETEYYKPLRQEIRCHLDIRAGDYAGAYEVLSKWLRLDIPVREGEDVGDTMRRTKFGSSSRRWGDGLDYAMLAVSAHETGHAEIAREALEEAEERGAEMEDLRGLLPGQGLE